VKRSSKATSNTRKRQSSACLSALSSAHLSAHLSESKRAVQVKARSGMSDI
jgi:hypothetical protein